MKRYILAWCSLCLLVGLLSSCNEDGKNGFPTGILYLNVEEDATMLTKAENAVTYESLQVAILQGEEDAQDTVKVFNDYLKDVKNQRLILPIGKYTIAVRSNGVEGAGWETPLYMGQEEVEVKQGEITNTKVVCTIANTKVSVIYEDALKNYFTDYQTTVSNPSGTLLYTRDEYRSGFFTPEKLTVQLKLVNKDGNEFVMKKVYPEIEPQYHYRFIYAISNDDTSDQGGFNVDIDVDKNLQEITYNIFIKEDELDGAGQPSAKLSSEFNDGTYTFKRTEETQNPAPNSIWLDYTLGRNNTLQSFIVTMDSPTLGKSRYDITKGEGSGIGFPALPDSPVDNSDSRYVTYRMDLTDIVKHLECQDNQPIIHHFTVDLLDDKFQETSITFAIKMMPDVAAYIMEPYCWSTFAVLRGNSMDESCYFVLTTSDGEVVIDDQSKIKRDDDGNMSALIIGLKPGSYSYTILSAEDLSIKVEKVSFNVYDPINGKYNVPNLGFDDWNTITDNKLKFESTLANGKNYLAPNSTNNFKDVYWESGNYGASASPGGIVLANNSTDIVTATSNQYAALIQSAYAGLDIGIMKVGAFSAGSIFIGAPTWVGQDGAKLLYGRPHIGLPTRLSGYYKYTPGAINYVNNKEGGSGTDKAIIYIALSTKQFELESLTNGNVVRFDKTSKDIFAYAELVEDKEVSEYVHFDIPLVYLQNSGSKMPTYPEFIDKQTGNPQIYITIVATSSIDGDKFTGSTSSVLYVDEFSLDYDYDAASFVGTEFENMSPININDK